jgi:starch synthase
MNILLASSEVHPYSKTGGLADMVGALAKALTHAGHRVGAITPLYQGIRERFPSLKLLQPSLELPLGERIVRGAVWGLDARPGLTLYFIDQPEFYLRPNLYQKNGSDYPDNAERFIFFSKAVAQLALELSWRPDLLHLHDWQTAFATIFLQHQARVSAKPLAPATCFTMHNLAYQGVFPAAQFALTNLPQNYFVPEGVEFYGQMNCLKAGLAFADALTTVSPRYAREITTAELGCGLDGLLRHRKSSLSGILNGVDYEEWNTISNTYLRHPFSQADLAGKTAEKLELQQACGLPVNPGIPLFGNIGRLVEQKGVELLLGALEQVLAENIQFVQLGTGSPEFQSGFQALAKRFPSKVSVKIGFDQKLSHRIEAGCDFFVMPSRFEPCGLNQMYGLRYATIPVVRATGGLDDSVIDAREDANRANGIKFHEYSVAALIKGVQKALALYQEPEVLHHFRLNAMAADFSWDLTAAKYLEVYKTALKR